MNIEVHPIGTIEADERGMRIAVGEAYRAGLKGLGDYSHVQVLWWADACASDAGRAVLVEQKPYVNGPDELGVFATRSPQRPNPLAISSVDIAYVDEEAGAIGLCYIDAFPGTSVLDLKPYTPSIDRVERPSVPAWCAHWPRSYEESCDFNWEVEFNF